MTCSHPRNHAILQRRAQRLMHCNIDRMKLMVARDLLRHGATTEFFEHDK
jgi:hypothetical protein